MAYDLDHILENSYRDFHAKGFDYLCLERSPKKTIKVYFFDGDVAQAPEAVIPHDHRYNFTTEILAGGVYNHEFMYADPREFGARPYERFDYLTPLNGGDGFTWRERAYLRRVGSTLYQRGDWYSLTASRVHTITVGPDTVIRLTQLADSVPLGVPTAAFRHCDQREAPSLDGLYNRMTADHALMRLRQIEELTAGGVKLPPQPDEAREGSQSPDDGRARSRRGHEFTPENTEPRKHGWRSCRACRNARRRAAPVSKAEGRTP